MERSVVTVHFYSFERDLQTGCVPCTKIRRKVMGLREPGPRELAGRILHCQPEGFEYPILLVLSRLLPSDIMLSAHIAGHFLWESKNTKENLVCIAAFERWNK